MRIKPMTVEEIKALTADHVHTYSGSIARLILAWAEERARKNSLAFSLEYQVADGYDLEADPRHLKTESDWLNDVLDKIGWPKDER